MSKRTSASSCGTRASATPVCARLAQRCRRRCIRSSPTRVAGELAHTIDAKRRFGLRAAGASGGVADVALPPRARRGRHRRARDLESHGEGAVRARRDRRAALHPLGARRRVGCRARRRAARVSRARAARDRELDGGGARAAALVGLRGDVRVCRNALRPSVAACRADGASDFRTGASSSAPPRACIP